MHTTDFFQCMKCNAFCETLLKIQKHIKCHENEKTGDANVPGVRRRGMLPVKKVTFDNCFVPVVKNQIDPEFLQKYEAVEAMDSTSEAEETFGGGTEGDDYDIPECSEDDKDISVDSKTNLELKVVLQEVQELELEYKGKKGRKSRRKAKNSNNMSPDEDFDLEPSSPSSQAYYIDDKSSLENKKPRKQKRYSECRFCGITCMTLVDLANHLYSHHKDMVKLIMCPISTCKAPTLNTRQLSEHLRHHSRAEEKEHIHSGTSSKHCGVKSNLPYSRYFYCKYCLFREGTLKNLKGHQKKCHAKCKLKCPFCDTKNFDGSVVKTIIHLKTFHPRELDPHNTVTDPQRPALRKKKRNSNISPKDEVQVPVACGSEEGYTCPVCKMVIKHKGSFRYHFEIHVGNEFECDFPNCNKIFRTIRLFKGHRNKHFESFIKISQVECPLCHLVLSHRNQLPKHLKNQHSPDELNSDGTPIVNDRASKSENQGPVFHNRRRILSTFSGEEEKAARTRDKELILSQLYKNVPDSSLDFIRSLYKEELEEEAVDLPSKNDGSSSTNNEPKKRSRAAKKNDSQSNPKQKAPDLKTLATLLSFGDGMIKNPAFKDVVEEHASTLKSIRVEDYVKVNSTGKAFYCSICNSVYSRGSLLQRHMKRHHNKTLLQEVIKVKPKRKRAMTADESDQSVCLSLMCKVCAYPAKSKEHLDKHMKDKHEMNKQTCPKKGCGMVFYAKRKLNFHIMESHEKIAAKRDVKGRFIKGWMESQKKRREKDRDRKRKAAKRKSPIVKPFNETCNICQKEFTNRRVYSSHMTRIHKNPLSAKRARPKCQLCQDTFCDKKSLRRHIGNIHMGIPRKDNAVRIEKIRKSVIENNMNITIKKREGPEWYNSLLEKVDLEKIKEKLRSKYT